MEDVKKRGRPAKVAVEAVVKENNAGGDSDSGGSIPKRRGRPANPEKLIKEKSVRGRGRPKKSQDSDASDDDGGTPVANGEEPSTPTSRGRPAKQQSAIKASVGRGRGRPKRTEENDEPEESDVNSQDEEKEKETPVSKRAQELGRAKATAGKRTGENSEKNGSPKKRGRPSLSSKKATSGTGRRGRPKKSEAQKNGGGSNDESQEDSNSKSEDEAQSSGDEAEYAG